MLHNRPRFIYRCAPNLRNRLAPNVLNPPKKVGTFLDVTGFYYCKKGKACKLMRNNARKVLNFTSFSTGSEYKIKKFITCKLTHVTYHIICPCELQYVGCTKINLCTRINEHLNSIKNGFPKHSLSNHFRTDHSKDSSMTTFFGIDKIDTNWRGGNMTQKISKKLNRMDL